MYKIKRDLGLSSTLYGLLHLDNKFLYKIKHGPMINIMIIKDFILIR